MSQEDYVRAYKMGKKNYDTRMMLGQRATLEVLDEILPERHDYSEVSLGLVQIPVSQIVGTRTGGRSNSFAANFMPILKENTEFADKWSTLSTSHVKEGIHEPVKAYEYVLRAGGKQTGQRDEVFWGGHDFRHGDAHHSQADGRAGK